MFFVIIVLAGCLDNIDIPKAKNVVEDSEIVECCPNRNTNDTGRFDDGKKNGVWRRFDSAGKLIWVGDYYKGKLVFELEKSNFEFKKINVLNDSVHISVPKLWITNQKQNKPVLLISSSVCDSGFCQSISCTYDSLGEGETELEYMKRSFYLLSNTLDDFERVESKEFLVGGKNAYQLCYLFSQDGVQMGAVTTWVRYLGKMYVITGVSINEKDHEFFYYKGLFQEIATTFGPNTLSSEHLLKLDGKE